MDFDDRHHPRVTRVRAGYLLLATPEGHVAFPIHLKSTTSSSDAGQFLKDLVLFSFGGRETVDEAVNKTKLTALRVCNAGEKRKHGSVS